MTTALSATQNEAAPAKPGEQEPRQVAEPPAGHPTPPLTGPRPSSQLRADGAEPDEPLSSASYNRPSRDHHPQPGIRGPLATSGPATPRWLTSTVSASTPGSACQACRNASWAASRRRPGSRASAAPPGRNAAVAAAHQLPRHVQPASRGPRDQPRLAGLPGHCSPTMTADNLVRKDQDQRRDHHPPAGHPRRAHPPPTSPPRPAQRVAPPSFAAPTAGRPGPHPDTQPLARRGRPVRRHPSGLACADRPRLPTRPPRPRRPGGRHRRLRPPPTAPPPTGCGPPSGGSSAGGGGRHGCAEHPAAPRHLSVGLSLCHPAGPPASETRLGAA